MTLYGPESRYGRRLRWWEVLRLALEARSQLVLTIARVRKTAPTDLFPVPVGLPHSLVREPHENRRFYHAKQ